MDVDESKVQKEDNPIPQSLRVIAKDVSDYYTKAEYTAFLKPKSGKEKKMRRKRKEEEVDPLEGLLEMSTSNEGIASPPVFSCVLNRLCLFSSMSSHFSFSYVHIANHLFPSTVLILFLILYPDRLSSFLFFDPQISIFFFNCIYIQFY